MLFTKRQTDFIKDKLGYDLSAETDIELSKDKRHRIFDYCVSVEIETSNIEDGEDISPEGETAASIVTLLSK